MSWYYVWNSERKGPVEQVEFNRLIQQGVIGQTSLVWREGMAEWRPCGELTTPLPNAPPLQADSGGVVCSQCGRIFAPDEVIRLGGGYVCAACKPIATQKLREGILGNDTAEQIRNEHLKHEASVKSVGILYFLSASAMLIVSIVSITALVADSSPSGFPSLAAGVVFLGLSVILICGGIGLRRLKPWARVLAGILSSLGLLGFPLGTLINGYILYLLFSTKGRMVFSPDYQRIIRETPHIKYRTSIIIWFLLGLVLFIVAAGMVAVFFRVRR